MADGFNMDGDTLMSPDLSNFLTKIALEGAAHMILRGRPVKVQMVALQASRHDYDKDEDWGRWKKKAPGVIVEAEG